MGPVLQYAVDWARHNPAIFWSVVTAGVYHATGAAVDSLETPTEKSSSFYRWFYKFANRFVANYSRSGGKT